MKKVDNAQRRELGLPKTATPSRWRITRRGSLEIQAYDEAGFPGLAAEWAKFGGQRPFVGTLTLALATEADDAVVSWIAAGTPPIYFGFGGTPVQSPADTIAMIAAACEQLGERALVCAAASDFSSVPQFEHVKVVSEMNFEAIFPALPCARSPGRLQHHAHWPARRRSRIDSLDMARSGPLGNSDHPTQGGRRPAIFDRHRGIAGRGPAPDSCP